MVSLLVLALLVGQSSPPPPAPPTGGPALVARGAPRAPTDADLVAFALSRTAAGVECRFDRDVVRLWFDAKGRLACRTRVLPLPEGARLTACVRTAAELQGKYRVVVSYEKPRDEELAIRGPSGGGDALSLAASKPELSDGPCAEGVRIVTSEVTVRVETSGLEVPGGDLSASTTLPVARRYHLNVGLLGGVAKRETTYGISGGTVVADRSESPLRFYLTFHAYPLSGFSRFFGDGRRLYGDRWRDRIGLFAGVQVPDASRSLVAGVSVEIVPGLMIAGGWAPRREVVPNGLGEGDAIGGDKLPTWTRWDTRSAVVGIAVDTSLAKSIVGLVK